MRVICRALLVGVLTANGASVQSEDPDVAIQLGGFNLRLGMPEEEVLRKLAIVYDVRSTDDAAGNWHVLRKGGPPYHSIGIVEFRNGGLTFASKSWGPETDNQTAGDLARALHDAVENLGAARQSLCKVSTSATSEGALTVLQCGRHRLTVFAPRPESQVAAGVLESLKESP